MATPNPLAPAAASLAELTPPASSGPTNHITLGWLTDPSTPCPDQADKLDQILAALSQQVALAIHI